MKRIFDKIITTIIIITAMYWTIFVLFWLVSYFDK